jgi:ParB family transcriptional regulator, chromosome partitioning protein
MATKRKALGRGLNALLPAAPAASAERSYLEIALESITPNKYQPRTQFDPEQLSALAQSIKSNGVVQPIIVRKTGGQYQLIAGERRWRAAKLAGLKTIPAVIRDVSEYKTLEWALIENVQREDLNPIEEATAYASLIEDFELTQEEVALRVGKDRSSVANYIRLLKLPADVQEKVQNQQLSMGHARALSAVDQAAEQIELANRILEEQLNVRQTEELIRLWKEKGHKPGKKTTGNGAKDPNIRAAEQKLQEILGTKVSIGSSKIEIHFQDADDLIRIYDRIVN